MSHQAVPALRAVCLEPLENRLLLSGTDYSLPGPFNVGEQILVINRTAGDSGSFDAKIFYPATSSGSLTPLDASGGPYPVVSFAHGYLTDARAEYSNTARHLASYGYLVVLPSSYESVLDVFEAESLGHDGTSGFNYLVTQNGNPSSPYYQAVDTSGYAAMGHSMGGAASISEASQNASVKTIVTWAAQNMIVPSAPDQIPNVHVPIQMIAGTEDAIVSSSTTSTIFNSATAPIVLNNLIGGFHFGFEDFGTGFGADSGPMPRATQLGYARSFSVEWLNLYMKGDQSVWRHLWGPEAAADSQVQNAQRSRISVTTANNQQGGGGGSIIDYPITVQNTGTYATSYSLQAEGSWNASLSALQTPVLNPGSSATVHVSVTVPTGTPIGAVDTVIVSARNDTDGGTRGYTQLQSTAINMPPVANAGGPYTINEGDSPTFTAAGSYDPEGQPLTYAWDLNNDGIFTDANGVSPTVSWAQLQTLGVNDGTQNYPIYVRVDDGNGGVTVSPAATLTIANIAPTSAGLSTPNGNVVRNEVVSFTLTAVDLSNADAADTFTFEIDWDANGSIDQTVIGPNATVVTHAFASLGTTPTRVRASDKDGGVSAWSFGPNITVQANMLRANGPLFDLYWGGTSGAEGMLVTADGGGVHFDDGTTITSFTEVTGSVYIFGGAGADLFLVSGAKDFYVDGGDDDDVIGVVGGANASYTFVGGGGSDGLFVGSGMSSTLHFYGGEDDDKLFILDGSNLSTDLDGGADDDFLLILPGVTTASSFLDGGDGDDVVVGSTSSDALFGGNGADIVMGAFGGVADAGDTLTGGDGHDVLIGQGGADSLSGGAGEDLILAGELSALFYLDDPFPGVAQVWEQWKTSDPVTTRRDYLTGYLGGGIVDPQYVLVAGATIFDDDVADTLDGGSDVDWFLYDFAQDIALDISGGDLASNI